MELNTIDIIIARRELSLVTGSKVTVIIGKPKKFLDDNDYYCPYQISGLSKEYVSRAGGVDEI